MTREAIMVESPTIFCGIVRPSLCLHSCTMLNATAHEKKTLIKNDECTVLARIVGNSAQCSSETRCGVAKGSNGGETTRLCGSFKQERPEAHRLPSQQDSPWSGLMQSSDDTAKGSSHTSSKSLQHWPSTASTHFSPMGHTFGPQQVASGATHW